MSKETIRLVRVSSLLNILPAPKNLVHQRTIHSDGKSSFRGLEWLLLTLHWATSVQNQSDSHNILITHSFNELTTLVVDIMLVYCSTDQNCGDNNPNLEMSEFLSFYTNSRKRIKYIISDCIVVINDSALELYMDWRYSCA